MVDLYRKKPESHEKNRKKSTEIDVEIGFPTYKLVSRRKFTKIDATFRRFFPTKNRSSPKHAKTYTHIHQIRKKHQLV